MSQLAGITVARAGSAGWALVRDLLQVDPGLAEQVIGGLADGYGHGFSSTALAETEVVELWKLAEQLFPQAEDPIVYGTHWVTRREAIRLFRNRLLVELADRGTVAAVECLRRLADSRPAQPWMKQLTAHARTVLGRADWTPLSPSQISEILAQAKLVLRNDEDLLQVVLDTFAQIQQSLQGATPQATLLWNHGKSCIPKTEDEICDYLAHELERSLPGTVINREVQVERLSTSGIGRRTDLLVQAPAPDTSDRILRVIVEVKVTGTTRSATP